MKQTITPTFFATQADFRKWLEENAHEATELFVGYYKVGRGKPSMTWSQSVDEALCFGWIDGVRRTIDEESYNIRFTPRKPKSNWSAVNIEKVAALIKQGLMKPAGLKLYEQRLDSKSRIYAYEQEEVKFSDEYEALLKANKQAWAWFNATPASYKRSATSWVMTAKQETTRTKRLNELIADSAAGIKLKQYRY